MHMPCSLLIIRSPRRRHNDSNNNSHYTISYHLQNPPNLTSRLLPGRSSPCIQRFLLIRQPCWPNKIALSLNIIYIPSPPPSPTFVRSGSCPAPAYDTSHTNNTNASRTGTMAPTTHRHEYHHLPPAYATAQNELTGRPTLTEIQAYIQKDRTTIRFKSIKRHFIYK